MKKKFKLFKCQLDVLASTSEVTMMLSGRGVGKSTVATLWCLKKIIRSPEILGCLATPSHSQTNDLMTKMCNLLADLKINYRLGIRPPASWGSKLADHKQYLSVLLPNGRLCQIRYGSLENYESFRGLSIGWFVIDECALVREKAYKEVLLPALRGYGTEHQYQQLLLTTPKGISSWTSELIDRKYANVIRAGSRENFIEFTDEKLKLIREMMSERQYRQEILGEVINISSRSQYHAFKSDHIVPFTDFDGSYGICSDQNVDPGVAAIVKFNKNIIHVMDEVYVEGGTTVADIALEIRKFPYLNGKRVYLYGDRYGNNRNIVVDSTYYKQLKTRLQVFGISASDRTLKKNPNVYDSCEAVNKQFEEGKMFVDPKCKQIIKDLEKASYNERMATDKSYDPHIADAIRYFVWEEFAKKVEVVNYNLPRCR